MDRRRVHARRSQHVVAIAHHGSSVGDPAVEHFDVGHAVQGYGPLTVADA